MPEHNNHVQRLGNWLSERRSYLMDCWESSKTNLFISGLVLLSGLYAVFTNTSAIVAIPPEWDPSNLPRLPMIWAAIIALVGVIIILIEGGYKLRRREAGKYVNRINELEALNTSQRPDFEIEIATLDTSDPSDAGGWVALTGIQILNRGSDSAAKDWQLSVCPQNGTPIVGVPLPRAMLPNGRIVITALDSKGNSTYDADDLLSVAMRTSSIKRGDLRIGLALFLFPDVNFNDLIQNGAIVRLSCKDIYNTEYSFRKQYLEPPKVTPLVPIAEAVATFTSFIKNQNPTEELFRAAFKPPDIKKSE